MCEYRSGWPKVSSSNGRLAIKNRFVEKAVFLRSGNLVGYADYPFFRGYFQGEIMKKYLPTAAVVGVALLAALPAQAEDLLTGDVRLACEATLCLSSGYRPHECTASLNRYFSIKHNRLDDAIRGRLNFLKLCPASNEKNMPQLINAIANGAGRCDAAELNRVMTSYYTTQKCYYRSNKAGGTYCQDTIESYVRNAYPSYCQAYFDHDWTTAADAVKFVGKEKKGGKWVNVR